MPDPEEKFYWKGKDVNGLTRMELLAIIRHLAPIVRDYQKGLVKRSKAPRERRGYD